MNEYTELVRDHFQNPRNAGELPNADAVGYETNPVCGDSMRLMLSIDGERIVEARFQTSGCPAAIATSSVCTEMVAGLDLATAERLQKEDFERALGGLPPGKLHCSVLAAEALRKAVEDYRSRI
jgi:nitrogen fixation NifU-like protein